MKHYNVVAAVIYLNGKYLCMQKGATKFIYTSYKFEFPGGKVEDGETEPQALQREIMEEMNYEIVVGKHLITVEHEYPDFSIKLSAYLCSAKNDKFVMNEHVSYKWLALSEMDSLDWAAADVAIKDCLKRE